MSSSMPVNYMIDAIEPANAMRAAGAAHLSKESGAPHRVLLVEDYEPNIIVAGAFLEALGYPYDVARNGNEALDKVKAGSYGAILMDVQMPVISGLEATQLIRSYEIEAGKKKRLPIIGLTAHAMSGDRERCLNAGMDDYLSKPFEPRKLKEKLQQAMPRADLHS